MHFYWVPFWGFSFPQLSLNPWEFLQAQRDCCNAGCGAVNISLLTAVLAPCSPGVYPLHGPEDARPCGMTPWETQGCHGPFLGPSTCFFIFPCTHTCSYMQSPPQKHNSRIVSGKRVFSLGQRTAHSPLTHQQNTSFIFWAQLSVQNKYNNSSNFFKSHTLAHLLPGSSVLTGRVQFSVLLGEQGPNGLSLCDNKHLSSDLLTSQKMNFPSVKTREKHLSATISASWAPCTCIHWLFDLYACHDYCVNAY